MTNRSIISQELPSMEAPLSPLSSRAKPRDLRFNGSFLEMFIETVGHYCC